MTRRRSPTKRPWQYGGEASDYTRRQGFFHFGLHAPFVGFAVGAVVAGAVALLDLGSAGYWVAIATSGLIIVAWAIYGYRRDGREWKKWDAIEREQARDGEDDLLGPGGPLGPTGGQVGNPQRF